MNKKNFFKVLGLMMIFLLTGMVGFAQSDLPTFDLKGNVRSCEGTSIKGMEALSFLEFSSTGKLLKMNGASAADCNNGSFSIKRNVMGKYHRFHLSLAMVLQSLRFFMIQRER